MITIEWLRQYRIGAFSTFDTLGSLLGVWLLTPVLKKLARLVGIETEAIQWLLLTVPVGVVAHILTGQQTPFTAMVLDPNGHFLEKIILLLLTVTAVFWKRIKSKVTPRGIEPRLPG